MAAKYKEYYDRMVESNPGAVTAFQKLHEEYEQDQDNLQQKFNDEGAKFVELVMEWENKLCSQSEKGGYSTFTPKLAEKFQAEVKKHFPLIDHVGLIVQKPSRPAPVSNGDFQLKKIKLF